MRDLDALKEKLHERGMRVTPQRQMIYEVLARSPSHPTVDTVHEAVAQVLPTVSLRTVYQALYDLEELGEICLAPVGGSSLRVDLRTDHHAHIVCVHCGRVQDVDVDAANLVPLRSHGFTVHRTDVLFSGQCAPCRDTEGPS